MSWARYIPIVCSVLSWPTVCRAADDEPADRRTNIILIMADDVGYECFGCYGSQQYQTPNIDRLAEHGMRFDHCYSQPLCTPSRVKLMTGRYNARNYSAFSILNRGLPTIGQYFQRAGYRTLVAGKWQLLGAEHYPARFRQRGTWPQAAGFERQCLWQVDQLGSRYWGPLLFIDGENQQFADDRYGPDIAADFITEFMAESQKRPFFIYYPMILVHNPFQPTPDSASRDSQNRPRNFEDMVRYMDSIVGRIAAKATELEIEDHTLILFVGDNGTNKAIQSQLGAQTIRGGKGLTTDGGTRVPLVASWPGTVPPGRSNSNLIDFSDFLPTLLSAAGAEVPAGLDGCSFLPQLRGDVGQPREWIYCYYCPRPERTPAVHFVRDQRWKLYGDGRFYDVANDPLEQQPVAEASTSTPAARARDKLTSALKSVPHRGESLLDFGEAFR